MIGKLKQKFGDALNSGKKSAASSLKKKASAALKPDLSLLSSPAKNFKSEAMDKLKGKLNLGL